MTHPTQELLERLESLMAKATPGPWAVVPYGDGDSLVIHDARGDWRVCFMATPGKAGDFEGIEANANLIVESRSSLPTLISTIRELEAEVERLESALRIEIWNSGKGGSSQDDRLRHVNERIAALRGEAGK